jgi:site-specific DNA recombinase
VITPAEQPVRCAIYTRKSTEEGLDQAFNSLDAQREAGEAFIASQQSEGWRCLPERYDDGGYTGGNMDRPALKRLLRDVEAGEVDCIVVYKVDRLSRSLLDFTRMVAVLEEHEVAFVSVTQQFNTTHSMGRLTLHILLSFAQFERELISERTRDKIAATRRKGLWSGGRPILGYDVDRSNGSPRLVVNQDEAKHVRTIFELYAKHGSLLEVVKELDTRGWRTKQWTTKKGKELGCRPFDKGSLYGLLTNVLYAGKVRYKDEVHEGRHEGVISNDLWRDVQVRLQSNGRDGRNGTSNKSGSPAVLKGLLYCARCGYAMSPTYTAKGSKRYRYYVCLKAMKQGRKSCPGGSVPAKEIESFVVGQLREMVQCPELLAATLNQARLANTKKHKGLGTERKALRYILNSDAHAIRRLIVAPDTDGTIADQLAELQDRVRKNQDRINQINRELDEQSPEVIDDTDVAACLEHYQVLWETLSSREQARILNLLIERIRYDGESGNESVEITYRPGGIRSLAQSLDDAEGSDE